MAENAGKGSIRCADQLIVTASNISQVSLIHDLENYLDKVGDHNLPTLHPVHDESNQIDAHCIHVFTIYFGYYDLDISLK